MPEKYCNKVWYDGEFSGEMVGTKWVNGVFLKGNFETSTFTDGVFKSGTIKFSDFIGGTIESCDAISTVFRKINLKNGNYKSSSFLDCNWENGKAHGCDFKGTAWHNGYFNKGIFENSEWFDGYWIEGRWLDSSIWHKGFIHDIDINHEYIKENNLQTQGDFVFSLDSPVIYFYKKNKYIRNKEKGNNLLEDPLTQTEEYTFEGSSFFHVLGGGWEPTNYEAYYAPNFVWLGGSRVETLSNEGATESVSPNAENL